MGPPRRPGSIFQASSRAQVPDQINFSIHFNAKSIIQIKMNPRKDPLESYLDSSGRLNFSNFPNNEEEPANEVPTQALMNSIKHITSTLISFGFPPLGNLLSSDHPEVQKTITCIYALLQQRQKDLNFRSEVSDRVRALESEKNKLQSQVERTHDSKLALEAELGKLQNSVKSLNLKTKAEKDKLLAERDELKRENIKLANKESQCLHELKKKDALYGKLQEQLRKTLGEKDLPVRNSIEIVGPLHTSGPALFGKNGDSEFSFMISRGFEENQNALLLENKELRSSLDLLQSELLDMLQQRKEAFQKRYQEEFLNEAPDLNEFKMNPIKKDLFNLPYSGLSEEVVKTFQENMRVYQRFMDKIDEINAGEEGDAEMERIKCVGDLKELLSKW